MIDTYTNSIIKDVFLKHKIYIVPYAVKTVENSFAWCEHARYTYTMIMRNKIFFRKSLIKSSMEYSKCRNELLYTQCA